MLYVYSEIENVVVKLSGKTTNPKGTIGKMYRTPRIKSIRDYNGVYTKRRIHEDGKGLFLKLLEFMERINKPYFEINKKWFDQLLY